MSTSRAEELKAKMREIQGRLRKVENEIEAFSSGLTSSDMVTVQIDKPYLEEIKQLETMRQRIISERKNIDDQIESLEERIRRLRFWLTIESVGGISTGTLAMTSVYMFFRFLQRVPFIFWYSLLIIAAVAFLPFMLLTLIKLKKYHWIWIFMIIVGIPASLNIIPINDKFFTLAFQLFPLLMFYVFCGILRWVVEGWLEF